MLKHLKYLLLIMFGAYLMGCSSGAYDLDEYTIHYKEKSIVADTVRVISENNEEIKEDITPPPHSFSFIVQIGAFINQSYFENFYKRAKSLLGNGVYYEVKNNLYKIRIGKYNNRAEAMQFLNHVKSLGYFDAFIITVKNR
jgi:cell division septation protein DedD